MDSDDGNWTRFVWPLAGRAFDAAAPEGCRIRPAQAGEADAMVALVRTAYASDPVWAAMLDDIERRIAGRLAALWDDPGAAVLVAECGGAIVGLSGVAVRHATGQNFTTGICVHPAQQGRGLGTALLAASLAWLRDAGLAEAVIITDGRAKAAAVYASFGAVRTEGVTNPDPPRRAPT